MKQDDVMDAFPLGQPSAEMESFLQADLRGILESVAEESLAGASPFADPLRPAFRAIRRKLDA